MKNNISSAIDPLFPVSLNEALIFEEPCTIYTKQSKANSAARLSLVLNIAQYKNWINDQPYET